MASKIPGLRHYSKLKNMLTKGADTLQKIEEGYSHFKQNEWIYDDKEYLKLCDSLNRVDAKEFMIDMRKIDFTKEGAKWLNGIARFLQHEDIPCFYSGFKQVVAMN